MTTDTAIDLSLDDIDLNVDPGEEEAFIAKLVAEKTAATTEQVADSEQQTEVVGDDTTETTIDAAAEETTNDGSTEVPAAEAPPSEALLEELRAERARLQQQLQELTVSSLADRRRLSSIEEALLTNAKGRPTEAPPPELTPQQISLLYEKRISEVDAALSKAEVEDVTAAPVLRSQLRTLERAYNKFIADQTVAQTRGPDPAVLVQTALNETATAAQFKTVRDEIVQEFPILDPNSEYFNKDIRDQIHRIYNPMIAQGMAPTEALIEATGLVVKAHGIKPLSVLIKEHEEAQQQKATKPPETKPVPDRKATQVEKNVQAATNTPPNLALTGRTNESSGILDKYDFGQMSLKEFNQLTDAELEKIEQALVMHGG